MVKSKQKLKSLIALRKRCTTRIQEIYDLMSKLPDEEDYFLARCESLDSTLSEFEEIQSDITVLVVSAEEQEDAETATASFERQFYTIKATLSKIQKDSAKNSELNVTASDTNGLTTSKIKLKKLDVPYFNGEQEAWPVFYQLFNRLIHTNKDVSKLEKVTILTTHLEGAAKTICSGILPTEENYDSLYAALVAKYEDKRSLGAMYLNKILQFTPLTQSTDKSLSNFLETLVESINALKQAQIPNLQDFLLFHLALFKLDSETRLHFEDSVRSEDFPTLETLVKFVREEVRILQRTPLQASLNPDKKVCAVGIQQSDEKPAYSPKIAPRTCNLCQQPLHPWFKCPKFHKMSVDERWNTVKQVETCWNCLSVKSHRSPDCASKKSCGQCGKRHHSMLHRDPKSDKPNLSATTAKESSNDATGNAISASSLSQRSNKTIVVLATARVHVKDHSGKIQTLRALLDSGSQPNLITPEGARKLKLPLHFDPESVQGVGPGALEPQASVLFSFTSRTDSTTSYQIRALVTNFLEAQIPTAQISSEKIPSLSHLTWADPHFFKPAKVDLLIGAALWPTLTKDSEVIEFPNFPAAIKTKLGYVFMGEMTSAPSPKVFSNLLTFNDSPSLDQLVQQFWTLENIPKSTILTAADQQCEEIFLQTHRRTPDGKFSVALPFKKSSKLLGESKNRCISQFLTQEKRLLQQPKIHEAYNNVLKEYLALNFISEVTPEQEKIDGNDVYYLPHHPVIKAESSSTPLRIVFNASSPTTSGLSLNDLLHTGPKLQTEIMDVLLNFRLFKYALTSDVSKMYLQIWVHPEFRRYQRFIWRISPAEILKTFQLNCVIFGIICSPYLALRIVDLTADDNEDEFPQVSQVMKRDRYVDDIATSQPHRSDIVNLRRDLPIVFGKVGFKLDKWNSNCPDIIPQDSKTENVVFLAENSTSVFGIQWNPRSDCFSFKINDFSPKKCTKRIVLSSVAQIYDPLGLLAPVISAAKILIKQLWTLGLDWDDTPPLTIVEQWKQFQQDLHQLSQLEFPRHTFIEPECHTTLIGFADASEKAYGAAIYIRVQHPDKSVTVNLLCAKSRVAPKSPVTIPRLELCAAVLLADLQHHVQMVYESRHTFDEVYAFTDSTVTLYCIKSDAGRWKPFVANRVAKIQRKIDSTNWYHVPGSENVSDCISRGLSPHELINYTAWIRGPDWLLQSPDQWPIRDIPSLEDKEDQKICIAEAKPNVVTLGAVTLTPSVLLPLLSRVSSYATLIRTTVRIFRIFKFKNFKPHGPITAAEWDHAENIWIHIIQRNHFSSTMETLKTLESLKMRAVEAKDQTVKDKISDALKTQENKIPTKLRHLTPFVQDGCLRVGGRLVNAKVPYDLKHQILLPTNDKFTHLLIIHYHRRNLHAGYQMVSSLLKLRFWIVSSRGIIRKLVRNCNICFKTNPKALYPKMAPLPTFRAQQSKAFTHSGVDFAGPFLVKPYRKRGLQPKKAYLCIFVCMSVKAIHVELCTELTTEAFLNALKRFLSRRGPCSCIYSDNGTNFVGAKNELDELYTFLQSDELQTAVTTELSFRKIEWKFNAPSAPHFGGIWERQIRTVKSHLHRVIGDQILTFDEFTTILVQIEALINSRPLCVLTDDPDAPTALTPAHFLTLGSALDHLPMDDLLQEPLNRLSRYQLLDRLVQDFWKRWHDEYLSTLQSQWKWTTDAKPLEPGTVVLIKDEDVAPLKWPMGRVKTIHPGSDKTVRVATVKTQGGELVRPLVKLCPLPTQ